MSYTTQRMKKRLITVPASPGSVILFGEDEDSHLNGGNAAAIEISNPAPADLTVTLWFAAAYGDSFVANATTVTCAAGQLSRIDITGITDYAMRITAELVAGGPEDVGVSVEVIA